MGSENSEDGTTDGEADVGSSDGVIDENEKGFIEGVVDG